jgi:hypothetical protein
MVQRAQDAEPYDLANTCGDCGGPVGDGPIRMDMTGRTLMEKAWLQAFALKAVADPRAERLCTACLEKRLSEFIAGTHRE